MADASRDTSPPGWGDIFAALPLETPPTSRWPAIESALDACADDGPHTGQAGMSPAWPRRAAWAAVLAVIALPALFWLRPTPTQAPSRLPLAAAPAIEPAAPASDTPQHVAVAPVGDADEDRSPRTATSPSPAAASAQPKSPDTRTVASGIARASEPDDRPATPASKPWPRARMAAAHDDAAAMQAAFEPYYMESARLERVIAATRDPRVGSGPAASLAGALDAELAAVDARLAQPGLDAGQRLALWRERVDVLRTSAELESQLRLLAAEGDALDGALVRVD